MTRAYPDIAIVWDRLRDYLGGAFDSSLTNFGRSCQFTEREVVRHGDNFYRDSYAYLYELTHFHFSPYKETFFSTLISYARAHKLRRLADFGCGIGLDGQALIAQGFDVTFYDLPSKSADFLSWRLRRDLGREVVVRSPYATNGEKFDLVYMVDVLEHVPEPCSLLRASCAAGDHICLNVFPHERGLRDPDDLHYTLDHWTLLPTIDETHQLVQAAISGETVVLLWRRRGSG